MVAVFTIIDLLIVLYKTSDDYISAYLSALPNGFNFTIDSPSPAVASTLNKRTSVSVLYIVNVDALYDTLLFFLIGMPFQTRKGVDFYLYTDSLSLTFL